MSAGSSQAIAARGAAGGPAGLAPGTLVGGRFEIQSAWGQATVGEAHRAVDRKTGKGLAIRTLPTESFKAGPELDELRANVKLAATLTHKNIVATLGMGIEPSGLVFVATELVEGRTLREVLADRKASGSTFAVRAAYNVVAHVCNAVGYAHAKLVHGAVCPTSIVVSRAGRVKLGDFGVLGALRPAERQRLLQASGQSAYLAPEALASPGPSGPGADLYAVGVLLFELLAGRPPASPSERMGSLLAASGVGPELDAVLARAMAPTPAQRFGTAAELKAVLHDIAERAVSAAGSAGQEAGIDIEFDIEPTGEHRTPPPRAAGGFTAPPEHGIAGERGASGAEPLPAPPSAGQPPAPLPPSAPGGERVPLTPAAPAVAPGPTATADGPVPAPPRVGARVRVDEEFRPSAAPAPASAERASVVDLGALLSDLSSQDAERWMVQKDKLDHGPFNARELMQQIMRGEVLEEHVLVNMDTGERKKLREWHEFKAFAEEYKVRKAKQDAQEALARVVTSEKRGLAFKLMIIAIVLAVIGAGVGIFFVTRETGGSGTHTPDELADLFAAGQIAVTGTAGILPAPPRTYRRPGGPRPAGVPGAGGGALSYEDAMNQAVDLGDVERGGGEQTLSAAQVAGTMNGNIRRFARCIGIDPSVRSVSMSLAIAGSGQIVGASVNQGSPAFRQCVASAARSIRMSPFSAPRMGASYNFSW
ncbi:MAG: serine/threonine protein kinase [Deltaproteobacteria bacterium]|nr:serine/threonine protein kinase [Deltaproteobacteria bacterium]